MEVQPLLFPPRYYCNEGNREMHIMTWTHCASPCLVIIKHLSTLHASMHEPEHAHDHECILNSVKEGWRWGPNNLMHLSI